ncbi:MULTISPECIES: glycine betaine ABC transporter substrate-binding protein [Pelosinus]|uniref:ABC-type glycine betaine transport, periplasmic subunit n=1 Tax=Pelosinus fermentans B4 TaxID=1149862 RepID=I8RA18_9FIRM|nr:MULTISPECIES: glycine betaine ABC transporter substrate-binding protein [Pelosinus]EIW15693.1 ABC-type glycine betaine transport, periplasmic subunit [Pelosinus fermentans B4]EIW26617.1 ABC-type glycine betaine transport, periplasmic subunit [Pelosinus fermentans A11]OAM92438.1 ABC-type glycine betaine transport, periplasmic subunit [Pelosinus fermentans DSM 17108]SDQ44886.1 glycine betaine/proline transport system substrate-binding protein [Pelosinus fermentans]
MKKSIKKWMVAVMAVLLGLSLILVSGCGGNSSGDLKKGKKEVKLGYVNWAEGVAMTQLAKVVLEDKMGYSVQVTMADVAPIFTSVANGDYDAFMDAWLPVTHDSYMKEYGSKLTDLGINFEGARIGLVVPEYVDIKSIEELNNAKEKFDGKIIGIDSGAGIMKATDKTIKDYGLNLRLIPGSGPAMTATLKDAVERKEWMVVTGWKPHWMFARWKLKFLEDPKGVYGKVENIHTVARKDIDKDMPEVAQFLRNFKLNDQQLGSLMGLIANSDDSSKSARQWVKDNEKLVDSWVPKKD